MPVAPVPDDFDAFLGEPRPAVVSSLRDDGSPVTAATWYLWERPHLLLSVAAEGLRLRHVRRDPRVSLTVLGEPWYTQVSLLGRVISIDRDEEFVFVDRLSQHYTGAPYPNHGEPGYVLTVSVERWHVFGEPASAAGIS